MSDALPPDPSEWPTNPYLLLGVDSQCDVREVKRAYSRLIRRFKPEQYPEQFRRIRDAYETLLRWHEPGVLWDMDRLMFGGPPPPVEDPSAAPDVRPAEPADDPLRLAADGDFPGAYRRLIDQHAARPGDAGAGVRMYWLLRLAPEVDPGRRPVEWLIAALDRSGLTGPALELLRQELYDCPESARTDAFERLWRDGLSPDRQAELARWRWGAACVLGDWAMVTADLERLRPVLSVASESAWLRALFAAADVLAWAEWPVSEGGYRRCRDELAALEQIGGPADALFDRLDELKLVATAWHSARRPWKSAAMDAVPLAWVHGWYAVRPPFVAWAADVARDPAGWLRRFDALAADSAPLLGWLTGQYRTYAVPPDAAGLKRLAGHFRTDTFWPNYTTYRRLLLEFSLTYAIDPEAIAGAVGNIVGEGNRLPPQIVAADLPLLLTYHMVRSTRT